ncbi:MAG: hypothetical protein Q4G26_07490 [Paracoccus sp. (in: a-proteobacteria)]|nr:hypothetical protein [Paracoccus sp. (in: a-proteobacteria)]
MIILDRSTVTELQLNTHYEIYRNKLMKIDYKRYRGLGEVNLRRFIHHGTRYGLDAKLPTVRDIACVIYLMSQIGSYFYEDPRFVHLHRILQDHASENPARLQRVTRAFDEMLDHYPSLDTKNIGATLAAYRDRVNALPASVDHAEIVSVWATSIGVKRPDDVAILQRVFPAHARQAARYLGVTQEEGERICLNLALWLGIGFYKDPVYPWIRDVPGKESGEAAKTQALRVYVDKRFENQLKAFAELRNDDE